MYNKLMSKKSYFIAAVIITLLGIGLRFTALSTIPTGIYWDEAAILADVKKVVQTGSDLHGLSPWHLIYPSYGDYKLAPYIWLTSGFVSIMGVSVVSLRLPSALAGVLTIIIAGRLALLLKKQHARLFSLATMLVVAISPWGILFSRAGFEGNVAEMFLCLSLLLVVESQKNHLAVKWRYLFLTLASLSAGLATWTYFSVRFVFPLVLLALSGYFYLQQKNYRQLLLTLVLGFSFFTVMTIAMTQAPFYREYTTLRLSTPSILNDDQNIAARVNQARQLSGNTFFSRLIFNHKTFMTATLIRHIAAHLNPNYLFLSGDANLRHSTGAHGLFLLIFIFFLPWGIITLWQNQRYLLWFLGCWWLVALIPASVPLEGVPHALRTLNALTPASMIIAAGLTALLTHPQFKNFIYVGIFIGGLLINLGEFCWYYYHLYPTLSGSSWQESNQELAALVTQKAALHPRVYLDNLSNVFYLWVFLQDSVNLQNLPPSENFNFNSYQNIFFNQLPNNATAIPSNSYLLGAQEPLSKHLQETKLDYRLSEQIECGDEHYLGVIIN